MLPSLGHLMEDPHLSRPPPGTLPPLPDNDVVMDLTSFYLGPLFLSLVVAIRSDVVNRLNDGTLPDFLFCAQLFWTVW